MAKQSDYENKGELIAENRKLKKTLYALRCMWRNYANVFENEDIAKVLKDADKLTLDYVEELEEDRRKQDALDKADAKRRAEETAKLIAEGKVAAPQEEI